MKCKTVEQFKILKHIEENFFTESLEISIVNEKTLKIVDRDNAEGYFSFYDGKIVFYETPFLKNKELIK